MLYIAGLAQFCWANRACVGHAIFVSGYLYCVTLCRALLRQPLVDLAELLSSDNLTAWSALTLKEYIAWQAVVVQRFRVGIKWKCLVLGGPEVCKRL